MKQLDEFLSKRFDKLFWLLSVIFLVLYLILLGGDYIWIDESYTFAMIHHSFSQIWKITAADVHPPFYYWYLKVLTAPFKYSLAAAKVASIFPYMFIIVFGGWQIKKIFNERTAVLFMGLFFCFPFMLSYSIEIRMYSLAAAFVFSCAVFAYKLWLELGGVKNLAGLIVSGVLAAYTHYFAFVSICIIYGILLVCVLSMRRGLFRQWLVSVVVSILLYAPWMPSFFGQLAYKVNNEYWIEKITLHTIMGYWSDLFGAGGSKIYAMFVFVAYVACFIWTMFGKRNEDIILCTCCLLVPAGTLIVGVLVSIIVRPVFVIRYLIPSAPLLVVFMSVVLGKMNNDIMISSILTVMLMGGIGNYRVFLSSEYTNYNYVPIEEYGGVDAYVVMGSGHIAWTLGYYVTEKNIYYGEEITQGNPFPNMMRIGDFDSDTVDSAVLLLDVGESPSDEYYDLYDIEYLGQWKCENDTDAFFLSKKF